MFDWHFDNTNLIVLATIDIIIVYLFCTLQISYNTLTAIYINKARGIVNRMMLWRAYLFAMAPVVYSLLPILLVLFNYDPNNAPIPKGDHLPGIKFALELTWIHIPPIALVFCVIIGWNIVCSLHNKNVKTIANLHEDETKTIQNYEDEIAKWDTETKVVFRKAIFEWFKKMKKELLNIQQTKNMKQYLQWIAKLEGWYIAKQRFQFFWASKKAYAWIKKYYFEHFITLKYYALQTLTQIENK